MTSKNQVFPTVTFSHSPQMEARRLLHLSASLAIRWYQNHDFLVLPTLPPKVPTATVIFPDLPYSSIPHYWSRVARLKLETPISAPASLLTATSQLLASQYQPHMYSTHVARLQHAWDLVAQPFWTHLFTLFPAYQSRIQQVNIFVTLYGPPTTFNLAREDNSTLTFFVRYDCTIEKIMWTLCTCLFRPVMQDQLKMTWREIASAIDWLLHESSLSLGLSLPQPTIKNLRSPQIAKYRQASASYLAHLGLDQLSPWVQSDQGLLYGDIPITGLTAKEQLLLDLLFAKRGVTVTYDEIADTLWPNGENFSLFAISKEVERLRRKIEACGIHTPVILAHRKVGYSLI